MDKTHALDQHMNDNIMWTYLATFDEIRKKGNVEEIGEIVNEGLKIVWPRKTGEPAPEVYTISYL